MILLGTKSNLDFLTLKNILYPADLFDLTLKPFKEWFNVSR